jgi:hypothetical protein
MKTKKAKINKEKINVLSIWVTTNNHSRVRRFWANEEAADNHADTINDDILSPVSININELRIDADDPKGGILSFLNNHAFIAVGGEGKDR